MLIDADRSARERTRGILELDEGLQIVAEARNAADAVAAAGSAPDVVVASATADLAEIAPSHPTPHPLAIKPLVLVVPPETRAFNGTSALERAKGIVASDSAVTELALAVRRAADGESHVSISLQSLHFASRSPSNDDAALDPYEFLTSRERQILSILFQGKAPKEIAAIVGCSPATIRSHHARILAKLHLRNDVELGRFLAEYPPPSSPEAS